MTGVVQGVNFRQSTVSEAQALRLRGWVRNEPDGAVAGEAGGPTAQIQKLCVAGGGGQCADRRAGANTSSVAPLRRGSTNWM